jgi:hypothetical protein
MKKIAVLSTDNNPDYYNLLPLACQSWRKLGYDTFVIAVGLPGSIFDQLHIACRGYFLNKESVEGVKNSTLVQLYRLYAYIHFKDDDILVTSDADMVIAADILTHDVSKGQIISYGYDLTGRSELPMCYVKATAAKWRELMGEFTIPDKSYSDKWEDYWSVDQQLLTQRAREYGMDKITFVDRGNQNKHGLPTGRWDRHDFSHIPDGIIDVHMPRNDWAAQHKVFHKLWPGEDDSFLYEYAAVIEGKKTPKAELVEIAENDVHGFLQGIAGNWDNHRPLLLLALSLTDGSVMEMGSGDGSTPYLRSYCARRGRIFQSFDNNQEWCDRTGADYLREWEPVVYGAAGAYRIIIFIDHAPGERRHEDAIRLANAADILVLHDTEEGGAGDYKWERAWPHFKYRLNLNKNGGGAGATAVSNTIDLNRFRGLSLGQYTFDND